MSTTISVYDTISQAEGFLVDVPENSFVQNRYFPNGPATEFFTKKVMMDFDGLDLKAGSWVKNGYKDGSTTSYRSTAVEPPRNAVEDTIDPTDRDRVMFEQLCSMMADSGASRADALENLKRIKIKRLAERIGRSIEKTCIQALIDNAVTGSMATSPSDSTPITIDVTYFDESQSNNPQRYTPAVAWGSDGATPYKDICAMCYALKAHGGKAREVLMAPQAWQLLRADAILEKYVSYYHSSGSVLGDPMESESAERVARVVFDGFALDIWVYSGMYEADDGTDTQFLPKDFVCVLAGGCGRLFTGGVTHLDPRSILEADPSDTTSFIPRRGKFIASQFVDLNNQQFKLRVESHPLPAPKKDWQWITMLAGNSNDVAGGVVAPVISVEFESEESVTLPEDIDATPGGQNLTFKIPNVANATADIKINGKTVKTAQTVNQNVTVELPLVDATIEIVYNSTL